MKEQTFVFKKINYLLMAAGVLIMALGYLLMQGGGSADPTVFSEDIFSPRRITWAPILVVMGLVVLGYAIMKKPSDG